MRRIRHNDDARPTEQELAELRPYLDLAREIAADVARVNADPAAPLEAIADVFARMPREERVRLAQSAFDALPPDEQWSILATLFDDDELREALADLRADRLAEARRRDALDTHIGAARAGHRLDLGALPEGTLLALGLFPEADARAALPRGARSESCARRLVVRATDAPGLWRVIEDVFNPRGGYFVTAAYDEERWATTERLPSHSLVRLGAQSDDGGGTPLEAALYPGGRVDVERDGRISHGLLHLGFATLGDRDVFAE